MTTDSDNTSSAPKLTFTAAPAADIEPLFRNESGWIGADGNYSVPLGNGKTLWLFSDTFVGDVVDNHRVNSTMINNSIGIQSLETLGKTEFFYKSNEDGSPQSFVIPNDKHGYFWLFGAANTAKGLYMFLMHIENTNSGGDFPFRGIGVSLGHVENVCDPPNQWNITQRELPFCQHGEDGTISFGSAVMHEDPYVYIYGLNSTIKDEDGGRPPRMILARVPADDMGEFDAWRFYSGGEWMLDYTQCEPLFSGAASEYSVSYLPALGQYACIYTEGGMWGKIMMRLAPKPEGPWGEPVKLYDCPDRSWHERTFSYAAKAHPELATADNELIITYATNSFDWDDLMNDARLYWPRVVRVTVSRGA